MFEWLRGRRAVRTSTLTHENSFEGFTEGARRVLALAQEEARRFGHSYIGTEHVLLGLVREEQGMAGAVLRSLGVEAGEVRRRIESIVGHEEAAAEPVDEELPLTPRLRRMLQTARREALQLDHNYVGTEHLLCGLVRSGLVRQPEGVAARVLEDLGVDRNEVLRRVQRELGANE